MDQLDSFGRPFLPPKPRPQLTTDAIVTRVKDGVKQILLITRGKAPFVGRFAFPGGHLDYNEDPQECVARELLEETGLKALSVKLHDVKGHPTRDPRGHYVSIVFLVEIPEDQIPQAGDDAATAQWYSLEEVVQKGPDAFAFDHHEILLSISQ